MRPSTRGHAGCSSRNSRRATSAGHTEQHPPPPPTPKAHAQENIHQTGGHQRRPRTHHTHTHTHTHECGARATSMQRRHNTENSTCPGGGEPPRAEAHRPELIEPQNATVDPSDHGHTKQQPKERATRNPSRKGTCGNHHLPSTVWSAAQCGDSRAQGATAAATRTRDAAYLLAFAFLGDLVVADLVFLVIAFFGPVEAAFFVGALAFVGAALFVLVAAGGAAFFTVFFCAK